MRCNVKWILADDPPPPYQTFSVKNVGGVLLLVKCTKNNTSSI